MPIHLVSIHGKEKEKRCHNEPLLGNETFCTSSRPAATISSLLQAPINKVKWGNAVTVDPKSLLTQGNFYINLFGYQYN